jgi:hypothetical protein
MTTPNDNTPIGIITDGLFDAGLLELGATPNSEQMVVGMRRLNDIATELQTTGGLRLWLNHDKEITLIKDEGNYDLGPAADGGTVNMTEKPLRVLEAYYRDSTGIRRPLVPLAWRDYTQLSQINQSGAINSYFVNKQQSLLKVFFWLIPDATAATGTCHLLLQEQVARATNLTETMNFPVEWRMALRWMFAADSCTGQPDSIVQRCMMNAEKYQTILQDWDVEDAPTSFQPDPRLQYTTGSFR